MKKIEFLFAVLLLTIAGCVSGGAQTKAERHGWHLSMQSYTFHLYTVMESLDKTRELGIRFIEIYPGQKLGEGFGEETFGYGLTEAQKKKLRDAASSRDIKIVSSGVWTANREEWEKIFLLRRIWVWNSLQRNRLMKIGIWWRPLRRSTG